MRNVIALSILAFVLSVAASAQHANKNENAETRALRESCSVYVKVKEAKTPDSQFSAYESAAVGFCKGYFRGFVSAVGGSLTGPDESGRIKEFTLKDGATLEQAIHAFLAAVDARPEVLTEDAGVIIMAALTASGLGSFEKSRASTRENGSRWGWKFEWLQTSSRTQ